MYSGIFKLGKRSGWGQVWHTVYFVSLKLDFRCHKTHIHKSVYFFFYHNPPLVFIWLQYILHWRHPGEAGRVDGVRARHHIHQPGLGRKRDPDSGDAIWLQLRVNTNKGDALTGIVFCATEHQITLPNNWVIQGVCWFSHRKPYYELAVLNYTVTSSKKRFLAKLC